MFPPLESKRVVKQTEEEYLSLAQLAELIQQFPASMSEAMAIVIFFTFIASTHSQITSRSWCESCVVSVAPAIMPTMPVSNHAHRACYPVHRIMMLRRLPFR